MIASFDLGLTEPAFALGYRFDLVLRGPGQTPMETLIVAGLTPFQTVGPYLHLGLHYGREPMPGPSPGPAIVIAGRLIDGAGAGIADGVLEFWAPGFAAIGRVWTAPDGALSPDGDPAGRRGAIPTAPSTRRTSRCGCWPAAS